MALVGIDLGTTNSLISHWVDGEAQLIPNRLGVHTTPSVVGLDDEGRVIVGEVARQRLLTHPDLTVSEFKRYMGTNKVFTLGKKTFRAEELSALVLKSLLADAEALLGYRVESAVVSVPAYFSDAQRKATNVAGTLAEVDVKRLINEPTAAAIAYGLHEKEDDTTFLVFDIGGGTFDVSILELFDGVMQVNSTAGDNRLGGEDFVDALMHFFAKEHELNLAKLSGRDRAALRGSCELCKRTLTTERSADIFLKHNEHDYTSTIDREMFETVCQPLLARLRLPLERALKDASLHGEDLDAVILVGGASRMPIIRSLVSKMLGQIPRSHINPDEIVGLGAAVQAALIEGDKSLAEVVLTDVAPYTLGVGIVNEHGFVDSGERFHPIIDRNSPVPISRVDTLCTAQDFQQQITLNIFQGEARLVKDNIKLGELSLDVPRGRKGEESIDVRFTYDVSGLLEVEAKVVSTGVGKNVVIEGNPGVLSDKEIAERLQTLSQLKIHPRENIENALIIARGERLYEVSIGDMREYIGGLLHRFEEILNRQYQDDIDVAVKEIGEIFDDIEKNSPII